MTLFINIIQNKWFFLILCVLCKRIFLPFAGSEATVRLPLTGEGDHEVVERACLPLRVAQRARVLNDSLNGCQTPSVTEPQRDRWLATRDGEGFEHIYEILSVLIMQPPPPQSSQTSEASL